MGMPPEGDRQSKCSSGWRVLDGGYCWDYYYIRDINKPDDDDNNRD